MFKRDQEKNKNPKSSGAKLTKEQQRKQKCRDE